MTATLRPHFVAAAATLLSLAATTAGAQVAARPTTDCSSTRVEGVIVADGAKPNPAFADAERSVAFWFRPPVSDGRRSAEVPVRVGRALGVDVGAADGEGPPDFLTAAHDAVAAAAHEHAFDRFSPDSASGVSTVHVYFGRTIAGGYMALVRRHVCAASAIKGNPVPAFPNELLPELRSTQVLMSAMRTKTYSQGHVRAIFVVDSLGVPDPATLSVLSATDPAFVREVKRVLPLMRYYPAMIDDRAAMQAVEQEFAFERR